MTPVILYQVRLAASAKTDILEIKNYMLQHFTYPEYVHSFMRKLRTAIEKLSIFPEAYPKTGKYLGKHPVYFKPMDHYLLFFIVSRNTVHLVRILNERVHWQNVICNTNKLEL